MLIGRPLSSNARRMNEWMNEWMDIMCDGDHADGIESINNHTHVVLSSAIRYIVKVEWVAHQLKLHIACILKQENVSTTYIRCSFQIIFLVEWLTDSLVHVPNTRWPFLWHPWRCCCCCCCCWDLTQLSKRTDASRHFLWHVDSIRFDLLPYCQCWFLHEKEKEESLTSFSGTSIP